MIPKLALAEPYNINLPEGNIAGIAWKDTNTLAIINGTTVFKVVWESMAGAPFQRITESTDPMYYRDYKALDFDGKNYVAVSDPGRIISEDDTTFFDGEYYFLSPNNQSIIKYYSLPVSPYRIRDISEKDGDVFISAETRLVRWNVESGDTLVVFDPTAWYTGITAGDSFVYVYNDDFYSKYIIRMDSQFNPLKTYAVMSKGSTSNRLELRYLDVDENGDLWAFDRSLKSIYKIKLDNE